MWRCGPLKSKQLEENLATNLTKVFMLKFIFNRFLAGRYSANICSLVWQRTCIFWRLQETACSCTCWWEQIISSDCNFTMLRHTYFLGSWFLQTLNLTLNQSEPSVVTWKSPGAAATQFAVWRQTEMVGKPIIYDDIYSALPAQVIAGRGNELFPFVAASKSCAHTHS